MKWMGGGRLRSTEVATVFWPSFDAQKLAEGPSGTNLGIGGMSRAAGELKSPSRSGPPDALASGTRAFARLGQRACRNPLHLRRGLGTCSGCGGIRCMAFFAFFSHLIRVSRHGDCIALGRAAPLATFGMDPSASP